MRGEEEGVVGMALFSRGGACDAGVCASGADGCRAPQFGKTPLMLATHRGKLEVARELISQGADIEAKDEVRGGDGAIDECC